MILNPIQKERLLEHKFLYRRDKYNKGILDYAPPDPLVILAPAPSDKEEPKKEKEETKEPIKEKEETKAPKKENGETKATKKEEGETKVLKKEETETKALKRE